MRRQKHRFPKHLETTPKVWRQTKRQEWRAVVNAVNTFHLGTAYTPVGCDFLDLLRLVERMTEDMQGEWIAW